jgi:hypothetical protein
VKKSKSKLKAIASETTEGMTNVQVQSKSVTSLNQKQASIPNLNLERLDEVMDQRVSSWSDDEKLAYANTLRDLSMKLEQIVFPKRASKSVYSDVMKVIIKFNPKRVRQTAFNLERMAAIARNYANQLDKRAHN